MRLNVVNFATISITDKELQVLQEASQFIQKVQQALELRHTNRIIRSDTNELIELEELRRVLGILDAFKESKTYWHQYTNAEEE